MNENQAEEKLVSKRGIVVDLILTVIFFFFMKGVLEAHVPSGDPAIISLVSGFTSFCLTLVFWLAVSMLHVTWVDWARRR